MINETMLFFVKEQHGFLFMVNGVIKMFLCFL
jgi:hypothetical protein